VGAVGDDGRLLARTEARTDARRGPAAVLDALRHTVTELAASLDGLAALGVACAGLASLRTDDSLLDNMKSGTDSAIGQNLIDAHYPAGVQRRLRV